jgi:hypothetical protein
LSCCSMSPMASLILLSFRCRTRALLQVCIQQT